MRHARGRLKAERDYYNTRDELQTCTVCGRLFTRYVKDRVCSIACAEKRAKADNRPDQHSNEKSGNA
jgi:hypothetical protein